MISIADIRLVKRKNDYDRMKGMELTDGMELVGRKDGHCVRW